MASGQSNYAQLTGGRYLADLWQRDSIQAAFLQNIVKAVNTVAANAGVGSRGEAAPPPPVQACNVTASGEQVQVSITHNAQVTRPVKYFSEVDTSPDFPNPLVLDHGSSRSPAPFTLPTKNAAGTPQKYYIRSFAQYPGSAPSAPMAFGGNLAPASVTLGGQTEMDLLPSKGSGTASGTGQQGASGAGKTFNSTKGVGQTQSAQGAIVTAAAVVAPGTVGSLEMPSIFTVSGADPVTADPSGGAIIVTFNTVAANLGFFGPASGPNATPTFRSMVAADEPATTVNSVTNDTNVTGTIAAQDLTLGWTGTLAVARGGTDADLSATGGTSQVLKQTSVGGAISVAQLSYSDISGSVPAAGSTGQIQFNNGGVLDASSSLAWDNSSGLMGIVTPDTGQIFIGQLATDYQGFSFYGSEMLLTGLTDKNTYLKAQVGGYIFLQPNSASVSAFIDTAGDLTLPGFAQIGGSSGPTWSSGSGAPSGTPAIGSIYSRTGGGVGTSFYVYNGSWVALA